MRIELSEEDKRAGLIKKQSKNNQIILNCIAIIFWIYTITKLFFIDIDIFLVNNFAPHLYFVIEYRFFFLIGIISFIWFFTKNFNILRYSLYILFFPIIIFFWKLPYFLYRHREWNLSIAIMNAIVTFIKSIKRTFIFASIYIITILITFKANGSLTLYISVYTILILLILFLGSKMYHIIRATNIYHLYLSIINKMENNLHKSTNNFKVDEDIKHLPIESLTEKQLEKRNANLRILLLFNRLLLVWAKKLINYQKSSMYILSYIVTSIFMIFVSVLSFSVINLGLFKIDSQNFKFQERPSFFNFFYYSFNSHLSSSTNDLIPVTTTSQTFSMLTTLFSFFIIVILIGLFWEIKNTRHIEDLNQVIAGLQNRGNEMEKFIIDEYNINNLDEALSELEKVKDIFVKFIFKLSDQLK